jgi:hypothetical protein
MQKEGLKVVLQKVDTITYILRANQGQEYVSIQHSIHQITHPLRI